MYQETINSEHISPTNVLSSLRPALCSQPHQLVCNMGVDPEGSKDTGKHLKICKALCTYYNGSELWAAVPALYAGPICPLHYFCPGAIVLGSQEPLISAYIYSIFQTDLQNGVVRVLQT